MLNTGIKGSASEIVTNEKTAVAVGSGGLSVYATPAMISLMEKNNMSVLDIVQIAVTQIKKTGRYHMMSANNPVFIIEGRRMQ